MRKTFLFLIAGVIALGFLVYMTTYTVRFSESAVVTTLGRVTEASVVREPGMRFKWPAPIQSVTLYDTRARFLGSKSETQQTADDRQIVIETFVTWKVSDPLVFNQRFHRSGSGAADHFKSAEKVLVDMLRSATSEVSRYKLSDLFTPKLGDSKLPALEADIMARLRRGPGKAESRTGLDSIESYGIQVLMVGINKVVLPESTTAQVFERMKATMERRAARAEAEGLAAELQIKSAAEADAKRIEAFAKLRAETIKNKGEIEASKWLSVMQSDPEFAAFLDKTRLLREGFGKKVMLVLPTDMFGTDIFDPDSLKSLMERPARPGGSAPGASSSSAPAPAPVAADAATEAVR